MEIIALVGRELAGITDQEGFSVDSWPTIDEGMLDEKARAHFRKRKQAVLLYLSGVSSASEPVKKTI